MAGNLSGAYNGASAISRGFLEELEYRAELEGLADRLCSPYRTTPSPAFSE